MKQPTRKRARKIHRQRMRNEAYAYGVFVGSMAKHCRCWRDICDSVLAGGPCEDIQPLDDDEFVYQQYQ